MVDIESLKDNIVTAIDKALLICFAFQDNQHVLHVL